MGYYMIKKSQTVSILCFLFFCTIFTYAKVVFEGKYYLKEKEINKVKSEVEKIIQKNFESGLISGSEEKKAFMADTLRISTYVSIIEELVNYRDYEMNLMYKEAIGNYDYLLNKYYKLLLNQTDDKKTLIEAQRAWIKFRDKELDYYSGRLAKTPLLLGTLDVITLLALELRLTKERTINLFEYNFY